MEYVSEDFLIDVIHALEHGDFELHRNEIDFRHLPKYASEIFARDITLANACSPIFPDYAPVESGTVTVCHFPILYEFLRHDLIHIFRSRWWYDKKDYGLKLPNEYLYNDFLCNEEQINIWHSKEEIGKILVECLERYITAVHIPDDEPEYIDNTPVWSLVRKKDCLYIDWVNSFGESVVDVGLS